MTLGRSQTHQPLGKLVSYIKRYHALRRFRYDPTYFKQLKRLQDWQKARMERAYLQQNHVEPRGSLERRRLILFFVHEIYVGLDLSAVSGRVEQSVGILLKLFHGTDMVCAALEFNALTGELDQRLTEILFETQGLTEFDEVQYAQACREGRLFDDLIRQKQLIRLFADGLNQTVHNRLITQAVKWAALPAKKVGFGSLQQLVQTGFEVLRSLPDAETVIDQLVEQELCYVERLRHLAESPQQPMRDHV